MKNENSLHSAASESIKISTSITENKTDGDCMYKAVLEGDWAAAEVVLQRAPSLARDEITERGDRALHVAAAMGHRKVVGELVERLSSTELALLDGRGCTPCCYAAILGVVKIADIMMKKNPNLVTVRDNNNATPLHKAALCGNKKMVSYFLKSIQVDSFSRDEWFDILVLVVRTEMYDVGLEILEKEGSLATMSNEDGTILHVLARQDIAHFRAFRRVLARDRRRLRQVARKGRPRRKFEGGMQPDLRLLVEKLWSEIQRLDGASVRELMKNPPILHDAARVGNVELITMLTQTYPNLMWATDSNRYTIFHVAVIHRRHNVFKLIHSTGAMKHFVAISQDQNGDNILHLAAKLAHPNRRNIVSIPAIQMQKELAWFKEVEAIAAPPCLEMRNKDGQTPRELFSQQHKSLLEKGETWMRNTADSCMLIATIMLTLVFTAAFTVPGGNDQTTGIPLLLSKNWFTCFVVFEALALFGSTLSIIVFWSIMTSSFEEKEFMQTLPNQMKIGLLSLLISLIGSISAFLSAYFLVFVSVGGWLVKFLVIHSYVSVIVAISVEIVKLLLNTSLQRYLSELLPRATNLQDLITDFAHTTLF